MAQPAPSAATTATAFLHDGAESTIATAASVGVAAIQPIAEAKSGISSVDLARLLGVGQRTVWTMRKRIKFPFAPRRTDDICEGLGIGLLDGMRIRR